MRLFGEIGNLLRFRGIIIASAYRRFTGHFISPIRILSDILQVIAFIASIVCVVCLTVYVGYDHDRHTGINILRLLRICQGAFAINVLFNLILKFRSTIRETKIIKWIVDAGIMVSIIPWIYPHPTHPWIPQLEQILYSNKFLFSVLGAYAVVDICYGIVRLIGKRTNPSLILSGSFLLFIIIGSFVLMLPKCTVSGISYIDSLFVATSAVSITGLTTIDISSTFTPFGLLILAVLIQTGALGVMTFTSFFALFFSGNTSIYSQLMVKDMIYTRSLDSLIPTLLYILGFTLVIELVGTGLFFLSIHDAIGMSIEDELIFSAFHALSAFCNAGFSNIEGGLSNPILLHNAQSLYIVASIMILAGGIGFPILANFKDAVAHTVRRIWYRIHGIPFKEVLCHIYNMNTKIVLLSTTILFVAGFVIFLVTEYNHSLAGMTISDKIVQSIFNSVTPRSAGFSSLNPAGFRDVTILFILFLMWIGGGSQSTAGGIKVNTIAAIWLNLRSIVTGREYVTAFKRSIAIGSIRRANAVVALSIVSYLIYSLILMSLEPELPTKALLFESCSALFTVGSSLGITPDLCNASKILLCTAMFIGRVGIISLLMGLIGHRSYHPAKYPTDNIIIN